MTSTFKAVGAFAILIALFMAGFSIATGFWSSSNSKLQIDLRHAEDKVSQSQAQIAAAKADYSRTQASSPSPAAPAVRDEGTPAENPNQKTVRVSAEHSEPVFDGALFISVEGIAFEGDPYRHRVIGTIGAPGVASVRIDKADVGYSTEFKGKNDLFEVRLLAADTFTATFLVTRTQDAGSAAH
jgi:hypothetical protein